MYEGNCRIKARRPGLGEIWKFVMPGGDLTRVQARAAIYTNEAEARFFIDINRTQDHDGWSFIVVDLLGKVIARGV